MSDKRDRDPFDARYDESESGESAEPSKSAMSAETAETAETADESESAEPSKSEETAESDSVRERTNVNMYLPDGLVDDLQLRYSELNVQWRREHGEDLPKNAAFYPAVLEAALGETSIEEELGLDDGDG